MRRRIIMIAVILALIRMTSDAAEEAVYRLAAGDVLAIGVWGIDELQMKEIVIRPDGRLALPLIGETQAGGLSPAEFTLALTESLGIYYRDPKVTVNILRFHTTRVYVLGQVAKPGLYELEKDHRVLDAVSIAGGYTKDAAKKKVHIIRRNQQGKPGKINLVELLTAGDISQNWVLSEGDTVFLSDNDRIDFARDVLPLITGAHYIRRFNED